MNTKTLLAAIVGGIVSFLLGYVVFGMLLMSYYEAHEVTYEGMVKASPNLISLFVANLAFAYLIAIVIQWSNMPGIMKGAVIGAVIGGLVTLGVDLFFYSLLNYYKDFTIIIVDIIINIIFDAIIGGVIGYIMGMGKKIEVAPV